ncbi:hypothetical protein [Candidatus Palauibacter sp.]|uniref:hypothetical protein n=1 Tax=Candidatus Palauibacter sp. TaxID=3101350 RepID=UPI003B5CCF8C
MGPLERRREDRAVMRRGRRPSRKPFRLLRRPALGFAAALVLALPGPASGQQVRLAGEPRSDAQEALRSFLEANRFDLWVRDTVLARADTVPGSVLVLEGTARIAGRIAGGIYVVDGDLFLRGGASVAGDVLVLGGGFYDSGLAEVGGAITYRPNEPLRVRPTGGGFEIISEVEPEPPFELDGTWGVRLPTYDRVNGLSLPVGALARVSDAPGRPELAVGGIWIPARGDVDFRLHNWWHLGERVRLGLFATSAVVSNDGWIHPTWYNSLAHFVAGDDGRNYYDSRQFGVELEWTSPEPPVWENSPGWRFAVSGGREHAERLRRRDVTVLFGDEPPDTVPWFEPALWVEEGGLWFARAAFEWSVQSRKGRAAFGFGAEAGLEDELRRIVVLTGSDAIRPSVARGDVSVDRYDFLLVEGRVSLRRVTAWGHAVDAFAIGRADVAGRLPERRYSTIGGLGTLPTMPLRGLHGARMVYGEAAYAVPLIGDAALGGLDVFARGSAGGAGSPRYDFELHAAIAGGLAVRLWDFQLEFGAAAGSTAEPDDPGVIGFIDVRTRRSARPTRMPPPR